MNSTASNGLLTRSGKLNRKVGAGVIAGLVIAASLVLGGQPRVPAGRQNAADFGSGQRYLTHVSTDKSIYRTGEKLYVRGVLLSADGHVPYGSSGVALIEIKGPKGDSVSLGMSTIVDSVIGYSWDIPASQAGGDYTVRVARPSTNEPPAERKFDIRAYRAPRLKTQIVFVRDGYGPGDTVAANLHVERAEGGVPAGARVSIVARVDGEDTWKSEATVDGLGNVSAGFRLPAVIARGEGTLAMTVQDGGAVETATKTIPILLQTLDLAIYPEGGELVAGLANRVYIEGRTPAKKPADMAGVVMNAAGKEVATFRTEHEGRGRFSFTPAIGEAYSLRVTEPAGIKTIFPLPRVKTSGVVLASTSDVTPRQREVAIRVAATDGGVYSVALSRHGREIAFTPVKLKANKPADVSFTVPRSLDGVIVATVYDSLKTPVAERLLFRQSDRKLKVRVTADRADFAPGDPVTLHVATTDDAGKPAGAVVGLTVTDSSVLEMIDKREQAPRLPVMVMLENDVLNLSDAHVYLDESNPKALLATDLLLGTQGWRRFAAVDAAKFVSANGDTARRALASSMITDAERARAAQILGLPLVGNDPLALITTLPGYRANPLGHEYDTIDGLPMYLMNTIRDGLSVTLQGNTIREYAHSRLPNWTENSRSDFAETVYWNAGVKTDASTGLATVSFHLSDAVTSYKVLADGFTPDGTLGSELSSIESVKPFFVEPKIPLQVTGSDVIHLPIGMVNGMSRDLRGLEINLKAVDGLQITLPKHGSDVLRAKERARRLVQINVGRDFSGVADLTLDAKAGPYRDTVRRKLDVQPLGYPYERATGGVLKANASSTFEFTLPEETVPGSVSTSVALYPTPLASLTEALQALVREPSGCFEQTSSTSYPMVMAQQYFMTHSGVDPGIIEKTKGLLDISYKKLLGFQSRGNGFEWFGADPGHEALTAYGLMQFTDMSQVRDVDQEMLRRTRAWLLSRRDGNGLFNRNARALDSFGGAPAGTTNAYITWALVESGEKGLEKEAAAIKTLASDTADSYIIALGANILHATGDRQGARQLMDKLVRAQTAAGSVQGATTSITRSGGSALEIETTALSLLAWMRDSSYAANVQKGMKWIVESNKSGRFGSTQSTILALRSIVAYDAAHATARAPGRIVLVVDGEPFGAPMAFTPDTKAAMVMPQFGRDLGVGKHTVALRMEHGAEMPFSMSVKYHSTLPDSAEQARIGIQVVLRDQQMREGGITEAAVSIVNKSDEAIPTPVAIIGIPGGLEARHDQLKELVKSGRIDAYEIIGREVILYWRFIKANDNIDVPLSLVAAVPGSYTGPASRAYLYYTDEYKNWAPGLKVNIAPR